MKKAIDMKYITYDKKLETYRVRVPGAGQVTIKLLDDALRERDKRVELVEKGKINIDSSITFNDWFYYWLEKYCTTGNQRTKEGYRDDIERSCQSIFNKKMLNIKPYHISELLLEMAKNDLAYSTIRRTKAILVATLMANNPSISYNNAAAFMGHSLNVFMRYYVHPGEDLLNSCSQAISDAFKKK